MVPEQRPPDRIEKISSMIYCEGCLESWAWAIGDRETGTFNEWYQLLDGLLLEHLVYNPLCWARQVRPERGPLNEAP